MSIEEWAKFLSNKKGKSELRHKLGVDLDFMFWPRVSSKYLHDEGWITDHLIGYKRTGEKVPEPTAEEYARLKSVLLELSDKLREAAERL